MEQQMLVYPGGVAQQLAIIAELEDHAAHDRLIKGRYWENGKGCAVGCTIKSGDHAMYETIFGIPQALARLEDTIFENLPNADAMHWPIRFMSAPRVGADLSLVVWQFLAFVVEEAISRPEAASVRVACEPALAVLRAKASGVVVTESAARSAAASAESAVESAASAAASAESVAESAASAAWNAAWSVAESAASAAWNAAWSAASAASAVESAASAASAESAAWVRYADKLLELMAACEPVLKDQTDA